MTFRSNFRGVQEWSESTNGRIKLNTTSDEAAKAFDAALTQLCGWYNDSSIGGFEGSIERMVEADPNFVLGRAFKVESNLLSGLFSPRFNGDLANELESLNKLVESKGDLVTENELLHVQVVNHWARSELKEATRVLERIITLYPEDVWAVKTNQDTYFQLGSSMAMRNSVAASLGKMSDKNPLKGYVHGNYAFALEESNMYPQARVEAIKALSLIPNDTWAIHNYAHCLEMEGKVEEGLKWMYDKKADWAPCQSLACHQYWHTALFHINNNQFDEAVHLLDSEILKWSDGNILNVVDVASLIYRMELVGLFEKTSNCGDYNKKKSLERWGQVYSHFKPHSKDHLLPFNDAHFMMSYLGMDDLETARELVNSVDEVPSLNVGQEVAKPLLEAMYLFKMGSYDKCADLLEPIRFDIVKIGGSHAQRDLFEQLLLVACLKSDKKSHNAMAERMIVEREVSHGRRLPQTQLLADAKLVSAP